MFNIKNTLLWTVAVLSVSSCDYYELDAIDPIDSVEASIAIVDAQSARAARAGLYDALQEENFDTHLAGYQYYSDEADWTGTFPTRAEFDIYNVTPSNGTMATMFSTQYTTINVANNIIAALPGITDVSLTANEELRSSILGEARFGRAFAYLELILGWGDVPLVLTPTPNVIDAAQNVMKTPVSEIYTQIKEDLQFAAANISNGNSLGITQEAANALLARVALYEGRYADALALADLVIGTDYNLSNFAYMEDEIWFLEFNATDGNSLAFFYGPSALGGRRSIAPSQTLLDEFEEGDIRRNMTFDSLANGQVYGIKYDDFASSADAQTDPIRFIRGAEMVLIIAEASANLGDFERASTMINMVRNRAGLDDITLTADNFEDAILHERFVELALESGHRLWDVRRLGRAEEFFGPEGYDPCDDVWPLPQQEIDRNPALEQNDCCNC